MACFVFNFALSFIIFLCLMPVCCALFFGKFVFVYFAISLDCIFF